MKKKSYHSELPKKSKYKEECDRCHIYKYDVHSYLIGEYWVLLCPECYEKLKTRVAKTWKEEVNYESESNKNSSNKQNGRKNKR